MYQNIMATLKAWFPDLFIIMNQMLPRKIEILFAFQCFVTKPTETLTNCILKYSLVDLIFNLSAGLRCMTLCFLRWWRYLNDLLHCEQGYGLAWLWATLLWWFQLLLSLNCLPHILQLNGFVSVWVLEWVTIFCWVVNPFPHSGQ